MPQCIYCLENKAAAQFNREHVLQDGFGRFEGALTLHNQVCRACNEYFANELDRYLLRDTIDGLNRFLVAGRDPTTYRSEGRRSTLRHQLTEGPYAGLQVVQRPSEAGLLVQPLPQVGFGSRPEGPFHWFRRDALPSLEFLKANFPTGSDLSIEFFEVTDPAQVLVELAAIGLKTPGTQTESRPAAWRSPEQLRVECRQTLGDRFARALAKICFNYLASRWGSHALTSEYDEIRRFIRYGGVRPSWFLWAADTERFSFQAPDNGHLVAVAFDPNGTRVVGLLSLHMFARYRLTLAPKYLVLLGDSAHFYDLATMKAAELPIRPRKGAKSTQ